MKSRLNFFNKNRITTIVFDEIDSMYDQYGSDDINLIYKSFCTETKIQVLMEIHFAREFCYENSFSGHCNIENVAQSTGKILSEERCAALHWIIY